MLVTPCFSRTPLHLYPLVPSRAHTRAPRATQNKRSSRFMRFTFLAVAPPAVPRCAREMALGASHGLCAMPAPGELPWERLHCRVS